MERQGNPHCLEFLHVAPGDVVVGVVAHDLLFQEEQKRLAPSGDEPVPVSPAVGLVAGG